MAESNQSPYPVMIPAIIMSRGLMISMSPHDSDELTEIIERDGDEFVVMWSPETAGYAPDYRELGRFPTRTKAKAFLATG